MVNYQNSKIYAIRSYQTDEIYVGSTVNELSKRMSQHRAGFKLFNVGKRNYTSSYKILEFGDAYIELIELFPCGSNMVLCKREGEIIRATPTCVNKYIAGRTRAEYRRNNPEKIKIDNAKYRRHNLDKINQKFTCDCGGKYTCVNKATHKKSQRHMEYIEFMNMTKDQIKQMLKI